MDDSQEPLIKLMHAAADECMDPHQRNLFDELGEDGRDLNVYVRLFRCIIKRCALDPHAKGDSTGCGHDEG